jgi:hypothetical protein
MYRSASSLREWILSSRTIYPKRGLTCGNIGPNGLRPDSLESTTCQVLIRNWTMVYEEDYILGTSLVIHLPRFEAPSIGSAAR